MSEIVQKYVIILQANIRRWLHIRRMKKELRSILKKSNAANLIVYLDDYKTNQSIAINVIRRYCKKFMLRIAQVPVATKIQRWYRARRKRIMVEIERLNDEGVAGIVVDVDDMDIVIRTLNQLIKQYGPTSTVMRYTKPRVYVKVSAHINVRSVPMAVPEINGVAVAFVDMFCWNYKSSSSGNEVTSSRRSSSGKIPRLTGVPFWSNPPALSWLFNGERIGHAHADIARRSAIIGSTSNSNSGGRSDMAEKAPDSFRYPSTTIGIHRFVKHAPISLQVSLTKLPRMGMAVSSEVKTLFREKLARDPLETHPMPARQTKLCVVAVEDKRLLFDLIYSLQRPVKFSQKSRFFRKRLTIYFDKRVLRSVAAALIQKTFRGWQTRLGVGRYYSKHLVRGRAARVVQRCCQWRYGIHRRFRLLRTISKVFSTSYSNVLYLDARVFYSLLRSEKLSQLSWSLQLYPEFLCVPQISFGKALLCPVTAGANNTTLDRWGTPLWPSWAAPKVHMCLYCGSLNISSGKPAPESRHSEDYLLYELLTSGVEISVEKFEPDFSVEIKTYLASRITGTSFYGLRLVRLEFASVLEARMRSIMLLLSTYNGHTEGFVRFYTKEMVVDRLQDISTDLANILLDTYAATNEPHSAIDDAQDREKSNAATAHDRNIVQVNAPDDAVLSIEEQLLLQSSAQDFIGETVMPIHDRLRLRYMCDLLDTIAKPRPKSRPPIPPHRSRIRGEVCRPALATVSGTASQRKAVVSSATVKRRKRREQNLLSPSSPPPATTASPTGGGLDVGSNEDHSESEGESAENEGDKEFEDTTTDGDDLLGQNNIEEQEAADLASMTEPPSQSRIDHAREGNDAPAVIDKDLDNTPHSIGESSLPVFLVSSERSFDEGEYVNIKDVGMAEAATGLIQAVPPEAAVGSSHFLMPEASTVVYDTDLIDASMSRYHCPDCVHALSDVPTKEDDKNGLQSAAEFCMLRPRDDLENLGEVRIPALTPIPPSYPPATEPGRRTDNRVGVAGDSRVNTQAQVQSRRPSKGRVRVGSSHEPAPVTTQWTVGMLLLWCSRNGQSTASSTTTATAAPNSKGNNDVGYRHHPPATRDKNSEKRVMQKVEEIHKKTFGSYLKLSMASVVAAMASPRSLRFQDFSRLDGIVSTEQGFVVHRGKILHEAMIGYDPNMMNEVDPLTPPPPSSGDDGSANFVSNVSAPTRPLRDREPSEHRRRPVVASHRPTSAPPASAASVSTAYPCPENVDQARGGELLHGPRQTAATTTTAAAAAIVLGQAVVASQAGSVPVREAPPGDAAARLLTSLSELPRKDKGSFQGKYMRMWMRSVEQEQLRQQQQQQDNKKEEVSAPSHVHENTSLDKPQGGTPPLSSSLPRTAQPQQSSMREEARRESEVCPPSHQQRRSSTSSSHSLASSRDDARTAAAKHNRIASSKSTLMEGRVYNQSSREQRNLLLHLSRRVDKELIAQHRNAEAISRVAFLRERVNQRKEKNATVFHSMPKGGRNVKAALPSFALQSGSNVGPSSCVANIDGGMADEGKRMNIAVPTVTVLGSPSNYDSPDVHSPPALQLHLEGNDSVLSLGTATDDVPHRQRQHVPIEFSDDIDDDDGLEGLGGETAGTVFIT